MKDISYKKWTITLLELRDNGCKFKVTRQIPEMTVSETKVFNNKKDALEQIQKWLQ